MEVQAHGNIYEDIKIRELTGLGKKEYDKLKKNGYTSAMDIVRGLHSDVDISIKTTGSNSVGCGDILKRRKELQYDMIVARYTQEGGQKIFHTEYTFHIKPEHEELLWGTMSIEQINEYANKIKGVDHKNPDARHKYYTEQKKPWKNELAWDKNALMQPNPKVDSGAARVQCSVNINKLINSGIEFQEKEINILMEFGPRIRKYKK